MSETATPTEIKKKQQLSGKVLKLTLAGAVLDLGIGSPGVLHVSKIKKEDGKRIEDVLQVGQQIDVWVSRAKKDANHVEVTMFEPLALEWNEIKKGMVLNGTVARLEKFGAFIEIGAERPGLAHVSELTYDYIRTPDEALSVGEEVEVKVLDFSRKKKQIKLSLKALQTPPAQALAEEDEDQEPPKTAFEIAYMEAMAKQNDDEDSTNDDRVEEDLPEAPKGKQNAAEREAMLARTLENRRE